MKLGVRNARIAPVGSTGIFQQALRLQKAFWLALFALAIPALLSAGPAQAGGQVALVIGNSQYKYVQALPNPANDAADMAASLQRLGFKVQYHADLDYEGFRRALIKFGAEAKTADKAVIFYAGHGVEIDGKNWLIPVDATIKSEVDVYAEGVNLETLIDLSVLPKVVGLIVLDACRNNPFTKVASASGGRGLSGDAPDRSADAPDRSADAPDRSTGTSKSGSSAAPAPIVLPSGLAPVDVSDNVLVAFSAAAGTTANDGDGRNSPYSGALLRYVEKPGVEINYLFRDVHDDVLKETRNAQEPAVYGTLSKDEIYLKDGAAPVASADTESAAEKLAWSYVRATNDVSVLRRFSAQFPGSAHKPDVLIRTAQLENAEQYAWDMVEKRPSPSSYRAFLDLYPYGDHAEKAQIVLASLPAQDTKAPDTQDADLPQPPPANFDLASTPADNNQEKADESDAAVEKAWAVLKGTRDESVLGAFAEKFPSLRHDRVGPNSDLSLRPVNSTQWMLKTADDAEVNGCFAGTSADCVKAIERYPDYVQLRFQLCKTTRTDQAGGTDGCMTDAVEDARARGYLVSAYTRSKREAARNKEYRTAVNNVQRNVGNIVSNTVSNVVSNVVGNAVSNTVSAAASSAAANSAARISSSISIGPRIAPMVIPAPTPRWDSRLGSIRTAVAAPTINRGAVAVPSINRAGIVPNFGARGAGAAAGAAGAAAGRAAGGAAGNAAGRAAAGAAGRAAGTAASGAAGRAAALAVGRASANAAGAAAGRAASGAAGRAAGFAASNAASRAASNAASNAASRAAAHAASRAASNAASSAAGRIAIPSDRRLKQDIMALGQAPDGLQLYRYRYVGDDTFYVGVMAQEVAARVPDAVIHRKDGYLAVDYARLGLQFMTFDELASRYAGVAKD